MASDGVTLDVVRTTVGEIPGAESSVDIAYDENGDRVWYSYSGTGQDRGFTEITVPGVGVYRADRGDGADGEFRLVRMDLVAGFSGAAAGYANYSMKVLMGQTDGWDWGDLSKSMLLGLGTGSAIGGLSSGIAYGLSEKFQWNTHEKVMKRALDKYDPITNEGTEYMEDAARYVYNVEGGTPDKTLSFQMQEIGKGQSHYSYRDNTIYLDDADIKTPSKLYSTVAHEMRHKPLWEKTGSIGDWQIEKSFNRGKFANALGTQEKIINREWLSHKYFEFWDQSKQLNIRTNYLRYMDFRDARFDLLY